MIYVGVYAIDECPAEPLIPFYLMISGGFSIFRTVWYFLELWIFRRQCGEALYDYVDTGMCFLTALMTTLYLFGLYWVLHVTWPNLEDPEAFNYCDPAAYLVAFVSVVGVLILAVFWCLCICVLAFQVVPVANEGMTQGVSQAARPMATVVVVQNPISSV